MPDVIAGKVYFPYIVTTNRVRLQIIEGGIQIAVKIDLIGTEPTYIERSDDTQTLSEYEVG